MRKLAIKTLSLNFFLCVFFVLQFVGNGNKSWAQALSGILPKYDAYVLQPAVVLEWNSMPNAIDYTVVLANDPAFTLNVTQSPAQIGTTWTSDPLAFGIWFWKVIGNDGSLLTDGPLGKFTYFSPSEDPNLELWLKADAGVVLDVNSKVVTWVDQSANSYQFQQSANLKKPTILNGALNGYPSMRFQGGQVLNGGDVLDLRLNSRTAVVVGNHTTTTTGNFYAKALLAGAPGRFAMNYRNNTDLRSLYTDLLEFNVLGTTSRISSQFSVNSSVINRTAGTNSIYQTNQLVMSSSGLQSTYDANTTFRFLLGAFNDASDVSETNFLNGNITELIFSSSSTDQVRNDLNNYLKYKYSPELDLGEDIHIVDGFCPINLTTPVGYSNVLWNTGATTSNVNIFESGIYWVQAVDLLGYTRYDTIRISYPTIPDPTLTGICINESITWNADLGSGFSYFWSTGETTPSIDIASAGDYDVIVTGAGGCPRTSATFTFTIDTYSQTAFLGNDTTLCSGNLIALQVGAAETVNYAWNGTSTAAQPPFWAVDTTGNYFLESVNVNGCVAQDTILITIVGIAPTALFSANDVCDLTAAEFTDASFTPDLSPVDEWLWTFGDGEQSSDQNPQHVFTDSGIYSVQLYVAQGGCGAFFTAPIEVFALPTASFTTSGFCSGESTSFANTSTNGGADVNAWLWNFGQPSSGLANVSSQQNPSKNYAEVGTFNVTLQVTDGNNCVDDTIQEITIKLSPTAEFTATDICAGAPITFTNSSSIASPNFVQSHLWDFGNNTYSILPIPSKTFTNIGYHTIILTVTADNGCATSASGQQFVHSIPVPAIDFGPACAGTYTTMQDVSGVLTGNVASSAWLVDLVNPLSGISTAWVFPTSGPHNVELTTTSDFGCVKDTMIVLQVAPELHAEFDLFPSTVIVGEPILFDNQSIGASNQTWDFGDGTGAVLVSPSHVYDPLWIDSTLTANLYVSNALGCVDTSTVTFLVNKARFDLQVKTILLDEDNGFYIVGVELKNLGTAMIEYTDLELRLSNGVVMSERFEDTIYSGQSKIAVFSSKPSAFISTEDAVDAWICAEGKAYSALNLPDEDLSNNSLCRNIEGELPVLIGPVPNPATDQFNFSVLMTKDGVLSLDLTDSRGRVVRQFLDEVLLPAGTHDFNVPVIGLEKGVYFLRLVGEEKILKKLVVE